MYILFPQSLCGIAAIDQRHISDKRNNNQPINNLYLRDTTEHHRAPQSTTEHHRAHRAPQSTQSTTEHSNTSRVIGL